MVGYSDGFNSIGKNVYLVKTDSTGSTMPIYVQEIFRSSDNIVVYPNPAYSSDIVIVLPDIHKELEIVISELSGRVIKKTSLSSLNNNKVSLQISDLADGIYFITVQNKQGIIGQARFARLK
jgi:hypothetical protein